MSLKELEITLNIRHFITATLSCISVSSTFIMKTTNKLMLKVMLLTLDATINTVYAKYCSSIQIKCLYQS
jgi:hypothetical protein